MSIRDLSKQLGVTETDLVSALDAHKDVIHGLCVLQRLGDSEPPLVACLSPSVIRDAAALISKHGGILSRALALRAASGANTDASE